MAQDRIKTIYDKYQLTEKSVEHGVELEFDEELSNGGCEVGRKAN